MLANALMLSLALSLGADKELEKLQGTWQLERLTNRGQEVPPEKLQPLRFVIRGDSLRRFIGEVDRKDPATIKLDPARKPAWVDLTPAKEGDPKLLGIYELDGDTLKMCLGRGKRPEKFESAPGGTATLIVLKRVKK